MAVVIRRIARDAASSAGGMGALADLFGAGLLFAAIAALFALA